MTWAESCSCVLCCHYLVTSCSIHKITNKATSSWLSVMYFPTLPVLWPHFLPGWRYSSAELLSPVRTSLFPKQQGISVSFRWTFDWTRNCQRTLLSCLALYCKKAFHYAYGISWRTPHRAWNCTLPLASTFTSYLRESCNSQRIVYLSIFFRFNSWRAISCCSEMAVRASIFAVSLFLYGVCILQAIRGWFGNGLMEVF